MKPIVTWILVADGAQAKVFEHLGPGKGLRAVDGMQFAEERKKAGDIVTDRPGRSFSSVGSGRSAIEPSTDPVQERERQFVAMVGSELAKRHESGAFRRLVIAAAPTALGDLRPALTPQVRETVIAELPKDLTGLPTPALATHLADILPV